MTPSSQTILFSIKETKTVSSSKEQTSQPKDQFHSIDHSIIVTTSRTVCYSEEEFDKVIYLWRRKIRTFTSHYTTADDIYKHDPQLQGMAIRQLK